MTLWVVGCSSLDHTARNGAIPKGESIVFGNISLGSKTSSWASDVSKWFLADKIITVLCLNNGQPILEHTFSGNGGPFYWALPPGKYLVLDLTSHVNVGVTKYRQIRASFTITLEQPVIYLGTIIITPSNISVTDDFDSAVHAFHNKFPAHNGEPEKQLMTIDKRQ